MRLLVRGSVREVVKLRERPKASLTKRKMSKGYRGQGSLPCVE
jgi:hypothetical protein